jgi:small subunit ribosomal protein S19
MDAAPQEYILQDRATYITEEMLGFTLCVYNGIKFFNILVESDKLGYKLGEFAPTRTFKQHSGDRKTKGK